MNELKCVEGCKHFTGGEIKHHKDCPYYPESFSKMYDDLKERVKKLNIPDVSGELPLTKEHICFDKGHAYFIVTAIDNGSSVYGHYKCSRCGHEDNYQYDYH